MKVFGKKLYVNRLFDDFLINFLDGLEKKIEKKKLLKDHKNKDIGEPGKEKDDLKKKIKDKQNKEASECLTKIESNLVDLSDLK